ncbi:TPR repeat-containing protein [Ectocarpus siliculosus]|uniref:TPR repeat-containing protein n=1 Tax=Ectocarpus siliculosus TaxID=2880 RepID=D7G3J8_ECTSI|nr:TPR repeat-containing protein [Ectocarpus siliculosus]|eukprot:CBJ26996.1 TPR repeat-containing protein [Ectocarpus siliculosus]
MFRCMLNMFNAPCLRCIINPYPKTNNSNAGAEAAQRHALALRCREWEGRDGGVFAGGDRPGGDAGPGAGSNSGLLNPSSAVVAAKRAAVPCLRNLASFVSNQGRHVDAEVVLRTVLNILRDYKRQLSSQHHDGKGKREADAPLLDGGGGFGTDSASFTPSSFEEKRSDEAQADAGSPAPSPTPDTRNGGTRNGSPAAHPTTEPPPLSAVPETGIAGGDESLGRDGSTANTTTGGDAYESGDPPAGSRPSAETAGGGSGGGVGGGVGGDNLRSHAAQATAALAEETVASAMVAATRAVAVMGETAATLEPSSLVVNHNRATRSDASPAPPPPSPVPLMKQASAGPTAGRRGGRLEESRLPGMKFGRGESGGDERGLEDVEGGEDEEPDQMAAVTRHHLAVVIHAQGRAKEAEQLLEDSLRVLKRRKPPQAVCVAQAMHDLAGIVRPADPARACTLYRQALKTLEDARGVNHFLTAPTLAKLGALLGESLVAAADIPITPAQPAGPGCAGIQRSAGLAEAVCASAGCGVEDGSAVAAAAGVDWDPKKAEEMIKRAVLIQGRHLGLRHPAVASSMRAMAELYRRQGRLAEAEPLFRRAIGIWELSRGGGGMDSDAIAALHGTAHCVLAGAGADWLGRFEEAFALVDQAYRIASSHPGNDASSRLLLEALRMIRSRQRQGRGDPQPASAAIMEGVWTGRWDPAKNDGTSGGGATQGRHVRSRSNGDGNPRCAVCLEEVGGGEPTVDGGALGREGGGGAAAAAADWTADIGSEEGLRAETAESVHASGSFAYLPCGHRFHTHCIGRWLAHSSSCPSCRSQVEEETIPTAVAMDATAPPSPPDEARGHGARAVGGSRVAASRNRLSTPEAEAAEVADSVLTAAANSVLTAATRGVAGQAQRGGDANGRVGFVGVNRRGGGGAAAGGGGSSAVAVEERAPFC